MESFHYLMPTEVFFGKECVKNNRHCFARCGRRAYVITYQLPGRHYALEDVTAVLDELGIGYFVETEIEENPCVETIVRAARRGMEEKADFLVAIGGGAPIDAAKAIGVMMNHPDMEPLDLFRNPDLDSLPIIAVPTTAGTGAEVAHWSVITRFDTQTKQAITPWVHPKYAFLDASYLMSMPVRLTRATALDALGHCIESYVSTAGNPYSRGLCETAFGYFSKTVDALRAGEFSYEVREYQMLISMLGGLANNQTGTCLPHGMSYALTHHKHIPHGLACGLLEGEYLRIFKDRTRVDRIVELCGFGSVDEFAAFIASILEVNVDVTREELEAYAREFAAQKHRFARHPEPAGYQEVLQIYTNSLLR